LAFVLFLLLNATLFLRPAEIIPALMDKPIYEVLILGSLVAAFPRVLEQLSARSLIDRPISACVVGLLAAIVLSHLTHFATQSAISSSVQFAKVLLYYLLLVAIVDSASRLRIFLLWLLGLIVILTVLALLQYHNYIDIPKLASYAERQHDDIDEETDEARILVRLCSTGIYGNPNDLARILGVGILICMYVLGDGSLGALRFLGVAPLALFGYALNLTHSRGGLLALVGGLAVLVVRRLGVRKSLLLAIVALPAVGIVSAGRLTKISATEGTGQQRIQLWEEGFSLFAHAPVFGIGMDRYAEEVGLAAHNSFIHCYTELGFIGGTLFFGAFFLSMRTLHELGNPEVEPSDTDDEPGDSELEPLRPTIMAITALTIIGMFTSTRSYSVPTYLIVGLNTVYVRIAGENTSLEFPTLDSQLVKRVFFWSAVFLSVFYVYVRIMVRHGAGTGH
jgi:hypothetical protein